MCFESYLRAYLFLLALNRSMTQVMVIASFFISLETVLFRTRKQRAASEEPGSKIARLLRGCSSVLNVLPGGVRHGLGVGRVQLPANRASAR